MIVDQAAGKQATVCTKTLQVCGTRIKGPSCPPPPLEVMQVSHVSHRQVVPTKHGDRLRHVLQLRSYPKVRDVLTPSKCAQSRRWLLCMVGYWHENSGKGKQRLVSV